MRRAHSMVACGALLLASCNQEERTVQVGPAAARIVRETPQIPLQPGVPLPSPQLRNPLEQNQQAIAEGKRLFSNFNCAGCHSPGGGGGIGPALIDNHWIYGAEPANIFDTIVRGRPHGMPSFSGKLPEYQIWQLVAFVQSLPKDGSAPKSE